MKDKVIAIDGPSGSGKSTIAKIVASKLNLTYLDTGAMFRAIAYAVRGLEIDFSKEILSQDESAILAKSLAELQFEYAPSEDTLVRVNGEDLTSTIREHFVSELASMTSKFPEVREYLKKIQRSIALKRSSVLEGRDIGTVIFPSAIVKIFLTASSEIRAQRRYDQLVEKDIKNKDLFSVDSIARDIESRDSQDQNRAIAPLTKATDAIEIDTSGLSIEKVTELIINEYNKQKDFF